MPVSCDAATVMENKPLANTVKVRFAAAACAASSFTSTVSVRIPTDSSVILPSAPIVNAVGGPAVNE